MLIKIRRPLAVSSREWCDLKSTNQNFLNDGARQAALPNNRSIQ